MSARPRLPEEAVMWKLDDWKDGNPKTNDFNPGKLDGHPLILIAEQKERRLSRLYFKSTKNWIYRIETRVDLIVYKPFPKCAGVIPMGISLMSGWWHPKSIPMEQYVSKFGLTNPPDLAWLKNNDFVLVAPEIIIR